jgi:hypothetical protein
LATTIQLMNRNIIAVDDCNCLPFRPPAVRLLQVATNSPVGLSVSSGCQTRPCVTGIPPQARQAHP